MPEQLNLESQSFLNKFVAGVDEVGRGSLFGDVVAAAVVLDVKKPINGLADSKKLTGRQRDRVFQEIQDLALFLLFRQSKRGGD
jgi:ribonuclease HII